MKRTIITLFAALFAATALWAQTPEEILARMDQEVARFDKDGVNMIMDIKLPLQRSLLFDRLNYLCMSGKWEENLRGNDSGMMDIGDYNEQKE